MAILGPFWGKLGANRGPAEDQKPKMLIQFGLPAARPCLKSVAAHNFCCLTPLEHKAELNSECFLGPFWGKLGTSWGPTGDQKPNILILFGLLAARPCLKSVGAHISCCKTSLEWKRKEHSASVLPKWMAILGLFRNKRRAICRPYRTFFQKSVMTLLVAFGFQDP